MSEARNDKTWIRAVHVRECKEAPSEQIVTLDGNDPPSFGLITPDALSSSFVYITPAARS